MLNNDFALKVMNLVGKCEDAESELNAFGYHKYTDGKSTSSFKAHDGKSHTYSWYVKRYQEKCNEIQKLGLKLKKRGIWKFALDEENRIEYYAVSTVVRNDKDEIILKVDR